LSRQHYYFSIADLAAAQGQDPDLAFEGHSPQALAQAIEQSLRTSALFERWRLKQEDPDDVDTSLAAVDPEATATGEQADLKVDLTVATDVPMRVLRHRMDLLIGPHWVLRDVR
jgi:hypothetical protein